jgi:hypothetical protein
MLRQTRLLPDYVRVELAMFSDQKRSNRRLGVILASIAVTFFLGFMAKIILLGG